MLFQTWNLRHGGGAVRTPEIALTLVEDGADVVVLTEFGGGRGTQIAGALREHGWGWLDGLAAGRGTDAGGRSKNSVWIASKCGMARAEGVPLSPYVFTVWLEASGVAVTGVYIPPARMGDHRAGAKHVAVWEDVRRTADALRGKPHVILGDFNTPRPGIDVRADSRWLSRAPGLVHLGALGAMGYRDPAYDLERGAARLGPTWFGPCGEEARLDFVLCSPGFLGIARGAAVEHFAGDAARYGRLSDHLPVFLRAVDPQKTA